MIVEKKVICSLINVCLRWMILFCCGNISFIASLFCVLSMSSLMSHCLHPQRKKNNWRQKHEAFIQTMRQGRSHEPQSVSNLNPEYVTCPHCGRKFAPGPAERHIPKCQNIKSRPAPPKQPQTSARKRTARWHELHQLQLLEDLE